jgi:tRNA-splicing ligase RtcB
MIVTREEGARPIKAWLGTKVVSERREDEFGVNHYDKVSVIDVEDAALQQTKNIARLPFIAPQGVALMPDAHLGKGATVGSVVPTTTAIIPSAVGVDIGCGMVAVRTSLKSDSLPDSLAKLRTAIEDAVPTGNAGHKDWQEDFERLSVKTPNCVYEDVMKSDGTRFYEKAAKQLGSLGSGNHFIEICIDESGYVWVMVHSGSRGIGNMIGQYYINKAKERCEMYHVPLADKDLAFLPEKDPLFADYVEAVGWAQAYAFENRRVMLDAVLACMRKEMPAFEVTDEAINCHHNYIAKEHHFGQNLWVTRKGAIRAREGDLGIIPGSMGQKSYIVRGKGNSESYCSCSHGAGRAMSRAEAKRRFSLVDLAEQTAGVECRKDADVIDEIPGSYKDLDVVMALQKDLVEVVHTLKAVVCIKGN